MSIWSMAHENESKNNADKIAEMIQKSDDLEFKKQLLPLLEKYANDSGGSFSQKKLYDIIGDINDRSWTYGK
jgi:hypothetical protein